MNQDAQGQKMAQIIAKCWSDAAFKAKLRADPAAVLQAEGLPVPAGMRLEVVEDTPQRVHWVLPARPVDLSDDDLEQVAGGGNFEDGMLGYLLLHTQNKDQFMVTLMRAANPGSRGKVFDIYFKLSQKLT